MQRLKIFGAAAFALVVLSGCADTVAGLKSDAAGVVASVADRIVPPKIQAPIANSAAAAENIYTAATTVLTAMIDGHLFTADQVTRLETIEDKVYKTIVAVRLDFRAGKDVTASLHLFNAAYGDLFTEAKADGVVLPTPAPKTGGAP